jgi:hypothetical protein
MIDHPSTNTQMKIHAYELSILFLTSGKDSSAYENLRFGIQIVSCIHSTSCLLSNSSKKGVLAAIQNWWGMSVKRHSTYLFALLSLRQGWILVKGSAADSFFGSVANDVVLQ